MATLSELDKIRLNLDGAIRILQAVAQDLAKLQAKQPEQIDLEEHLDTVQQAEALWGDETRQRQLTRN